MSGSQSAPLRILITDEVRFLTNFHFIDETNVKYQEAETFDKDCRKFKLNISESSLREVIEEKGDLPFWICQMMQKESGQFNSLVPKRKDEQFTCDSNQIYPSVIHDHIKETLYGAAEGVASWVTHSPSKTEVEEKLKSHCLNYPRSNQCLGAQKLVERNLEQFMAKALCPALQNPHLRGDSSIKNQ